MGAACGFLAATVILTNNIRDIHGDKLVGKKTLAVIVGHRVAVMLLQGMLVLPYILVVLFSDVLPQGASLNILKYSFFFALLLLWKIGKIGTQRTEAAHYNPVLILAVVHLIIFSVSYIVD